MSCRQVGDQEKISPVTSLRDVYITETNNLLLLNRGGPRPIRD